MLTVVKFKRPGQQNGVYDAETRWNGNPSGVARGGAGGAMAPPLIWSVG